MSWPETVRLAGLPKKSAEKSILPVLVAGQVGQVERRDAEHRPGPLGVAGGDDRRVDPEESVLVEVAVHGHRQAVADPRHRAERVGPRPQVGHRPQVLERVPLGRDRVVVGVLDPADHLDPIGLDLEPLPLALRLDQRALDPHGAVRGQVEDLGLIVRQRRLGDDLDRVEARAVVDLEEREPGLGVAPGADPALDGDRLADVHPAGQDLLDRQRRHDPSPRWHETDCTCPAIIRPGRRLVHA